MDRLEGESARVVRQPPGRRVDVEPIAMRCRERTQRKFRHLAALGVEKPCLVPSPCLENPCLNHQSETINTEHEPWLAAWGVKKTCLVYHEALPGCTVKPIP